MDNKYICAFSKLRSGQANNNLGASCGSYFVHVPYHGTAIFRVVTICGFLTRFFLSQRGL
jgi:hypothetical protein